MRHNEGMACRVFKDHRADVWGDKVLCCQIPDIVVYMYLVLVLCSFDTGSKC